MGYLCLFTTVSVMCGRRVCVCAPRSSCSYLMSSERMRYTDALDYVRKLRPDVRPNDGFQRQLKAYDTTVCRH